MDDLWRRIYDELLLDGFIGRVPGLPDRLASGIAAADIGCGSGHAFNLLARAFPASRFVGYDIGADAIAAATAEAEAMGLSTNPHRWSMRSSTNSTLWRANASAVIAAWDRPRRRGRSSTIASGGSATGA